MIERLRSKQDLRAVNAVELAEASLVEVDGGVLGLGQVHRLKILVNLEGWSG